MTTDPQDPAPVPDNGAGPGFSTLAAIQDRLADLAGDVRYLKARMERQGIGDTDFPGELATLKEQVTKLAKLIDDLLAYGPSVQAPFWLGLTEAQYADQIKPVRAWVKTFLIAEYATGTKRCWENHRVLVWEISTMYAFWCTIYLAPNKKLPAAMDFYDRWLPGLVRRITEAQKNCKESLCSVKGSDGYTGNGSASVQRRE